MKTLKEIKEQFEQTNARGDKVNILAYHPEQAYPIIAEYYYEGEWQSTKHKCGGGAWEFGEFPCVELNLIPKKVGIDYSKLPKDTLCEVNGEGITPLLRYSDGEGQFYQEGRTSKTRNFAHKTMVWSSMKVIENKPVAWFGGKCPIPEGVKFRVWYRNGETDEGAMGFDGSHGGFGNGGDIIAYQILGEL